MAGMELDSREGLPDELAYLRQSYAKEIWRTHANFGELTRFWLHVHDSLRHHGQTLGRITEDFREGRLDSHQFQRTFVPGLNQFLQHLNAHHQIEDHQYFPRFRLLDERMVAGFDLLEKDHHRIHEALLSSAGAANDFLATLGKDADSLRSAGDGYAKASAQLLAFLLRHLADEEDLVVPAMLHHGERSIG
jgi:hemerythrin HHE cation binding domain-containing protein